MNLSRILIGLCVTITLGFGNFAGSGPPSARASPLAEDSPPYEDQDTLDKLPDMYDEMHRPVVKPGISPAASQMEDQFGYVTDNSVAFNWVDAMDGIEVFVDGQSDTDDGYSEAIDIGFDFKFYEHIYQQIYIGTNGLVTFGAGSDSFANRPIPEDTPPNSLIAPFWDDLEIGDGRVFYKSRDIGGGKSFVVEWFQVNHYGGSNILTFEIILYENGNILFQYKSMNGDLEAATVGIEDGDGIDGLQFLFNAPGINSGKAIRFLRPGPAPRVKIISSLSSGFTTYGSVDFIFEVINTNEIGEDTFDLASIVSIPNWSVSFYSADGQSVLIDHDNDGKIDTGIISHGERKSFVARVSAPKYAGLGDNSNIELKVTSSDDSSISASADFQAALPSPFVQVYADSQSGIFLDLIWGQASTVSQVSNFFTGNTLSIVTSEDGKLISAWERNGGKTEGNQPVYYSDIEFTIADGSGGLTTETTKITNNSSSSTPTIFVNARYPAIAAAPNDKIGVLWAQYILDLPNQRTNSNIYFAILNPDGSLSSGPINVTGNDEWRGDGNEDVPVFSSPQIATTEDNHFFLAWVESKKASGADSSNIQFAIYDPLGSQIKGPALFSQSIPGSTLHIDPAVTGLNGNRILLAFSIFDQSAGNPYQVSYGLLQSDGQIIQEAVSIQDAFGWRLDALQLDGRNILIAWTNPMTDRITYATLDESGTNLLSAPKEMPPVDTRKPDYVSVAGTKGDNAVLTWMDAEWKDSLYYSMVAADGDLMTPPMIFLRGEATNPLIQTSFTGQGIAKFEKKWETFLPGVNR
jgi:hypothetical protein